MLAFIWFVICILLVGLCWRFSDQLDQTREQLALVRDKLARTEENLRELQKCLERIKADALRVGNEYQEATLEVAQVVKQRDDLKESLGLINHRNTELENKCKRLSEENQKLLRTKAVTRDLQIEKDELIDRLKMFSALVKDWEECQTTGNKNISTESPAPTQKPSIRVIPNS